MYVAPIDTINQNRRTGIAGRDDSRPDNTKISRERNLIASVGRNERGAVPQIHIGRRRASWTMTTGTIGMEI